VGSDNVRATDLTPGVAGDEISLRGPGGQPIFAHASRPRALLIGEGAGVGPILYVAEQMRAQPSSLDVSAAPSSPTARWKPLVLLGSDIPFPFGPRPSVIVVPGIPIGVIACMPLLEEWGIASRLASRLDLPGCFDGPVTELAAAWLSSLGPSGLADVEIFARGPTPMLEATANLARHYAVPCQT
jgi:dihydroorotate dehydrogenase electron transfer subunit